MGYIESKLPELEAYLPPLTKLPDFDEFWEDTLRQAKSVPLEPARTRAAYPSPYVEVYDISYFGFDDTPIRGRLVIPAFAKKEKYPCLIQYHGFGGSAEKPAGLMHWAMVGLAVLAVDCRGQSGQTGNKAGYSGGVATNVCTYGILSKREYYYRALYMDSLKAIDFAQACPEIDGGRIILRGTSQGGALGMAVCSLDSRPALGLFNVPSNSDLRRRVESRAGAYASVNDYLRAHPDRIEAAYETLSYFDTMNMADRIACPVYASVALSDPVCPAICYFASYNRIKSKKSIEIYPFNEHDGASGFHLERELGRIAESGLLG
jgi:cephalosporin-C deacetylase